VPAEVDGMKRDSVTKRVFPTILVAGVLVVGLGATVSPSVGAETTRHKEAVANDRSRASVEIPLYCLATSCDAGSGYSSRVGSSPNLSGPPALQTFTQSAMAVTPGSQVSLHWSTAAGQYFLLTSAAPTALPNFDSTSTVIWPASPGASWSTSSQSWTTTGDEVTVSVPSNAPAGDTFGVQLVTCVSGGLCSDSSGGGGDAQVSLVVATNWTVESYKDNFPKVSMTPQSAGAPLDVTFGTASAIWSSSEFSDALGESPKKAPLTLFADPADLANTPFASCFATPCVASGFSALGERVIYADKLVWFTQGGWLGFPGGSVPNHSEVVAFNPRTQGFCTYLVPGNDNEVIGMAATGTGKNTVIWFVESDLAGGHPALDSFTPAKVGDSCPNEYSLTGVGTFRQIAWPDDDVPAQIAVDPGGTTLWVSDFYGSRVERVTMATGAVTTYSYPSTNLYSTHGADPWQVVADRNYVYAIDYGDDNLIRINKADGQIDQVTIPLTSDTEEGYGLSLSGNYLYFSLSDDAQPAVGAASTIGYVDIAAWEAASGACAAGVDCAPAPTGGVVYTGLAAQTDPSSDADFRGIDAGAGGVVALADLRQVIRLDR
jgi:hypothetical protein